MAFLNDVCLAANDVGFANDVHSVNDVASLMFLANITSLRRMEQHHFERSEKHHIAAAMHH